MMKKLAVLVALTLVLVLALAAPAFAVSGANGEGRGFGQHHAAHAQAEGGFNAEMNPGMHRGFSGWPPE